MSPPCTNTAYGQPSTSRTSELKKQRTSLLEADESRIAPPAVLRRSEGTRFSSRSDDEVGGLQSAIRAERAWRARQFNMKKFHRRRGMITTQLSAYEVQLLSSLIMQLIELVSDGEPEGFPPAQNPPIRSRRSSRIWRATGRAGTIRGPGAQAALP